MRTRWPLVLLGATSGCDFGWKASPTHEDECETGASGCDPIEIVPSDANRVLRAGETDIAFGSALGAADLDGDGWHELIAGAPSAWSGAGGVWIFEPEVRVRAAVIGPADASGFGSAVAGVGDLDGDGLDETLIGAPDTDEGAGAFFVLAGDDATTALDLGDTLRLASTVALAEAGASLGSAVAGLGRLDETDADSTAVLVGAPHTDGGAGAAWLLLGPHTSWQVDTAVRLTGDRSNGLAGLSVVKAGDTDGDGIGGLLVGAPGINAGEIDRGVALLLESAADLDPGAEVLLWGDADTRLLGAAADEAAGTAVLGGEDLDGDGLADLVIGAPGAESGAGLLYIMSSMALSSGTEYLNTGAVVTAGTDGVGLGERIGFAPMGVDEPPAIAVFTQTETQATLGLVAAPLSGLRVSVRDVLIAQIGPFEDDDPADSLTSIGVQRLASGDAGDLVVGVPQEGAGGAVRIFFDWIR